ncbi:MULTISPECIES: electron transport complex subunit RsxB [unclassified Acidovorax]|jgi:electron transport complex protein RnfB|uniref:electron transport complex subunit RsxB n=1 Tax=unclassified Acidovorax TaxID=2684926 RepID=UPI000B3FB668|nr:electron transport complex subunit RsxB [Acidovorax sp. JG5]MBP3981437.1 electron transport complex subunit RsxB [Acidovorax sp. JG5]
MPGLLPATGLAERINAALPQTQCTRCGYPDCASYAQAIAEGLASINQCPPGGQEGVARLAAITGQAVQPLNPENGLEAPRTVAVIDENWCIGCTLCIKACPTDAIVGANKFMHTVMSAHCTGCELCIPVCPVDCIQLENASGNATGWAAWTQTQADSARQRYAHRQQRLVQHGAATPEAGPDTDTPPDARPAPAADSARAAPASTAPEARQAAIATAMARARERRNPPSP